MPYGPKSGQIAVKVINRFGEDVMKVFAVWERVFAMTGKQRALNMLIGSGSLFGGGALIKADFELGPLLGCLLLLYGTVGLVCSLTAPGEGKKIGNAPRKAGVVDKVVDADGPKYGCLLLVIIIGYVERNSEKFGFSIVGVIIMGLIFFGIDKLSKK